MVGVVVREQDSLFFSLWLIKANTSHVLEFPVSGEKESAESEAVGVSHMIKSKMNRYFFFFKFDSVTRKHPSPLMRVLLNLLFAVLTLASVLTFVIKLYFYFDKLNIWVFFFVCFFCFFTDSDINQLIKSL